MNLWTVLKQTFTPTQENRDMDARGLMEKLTDLDAQIATTHAVIRDLEGQQTDAMAEGFLSDRQDGRVADLAKRLTEAKLRLAELESIKPSLCDRLQAARAAKRDALIQDFTARIGQAGKRQESIKTQIADLDTQRGFLLAAFEAAERAVRDSVAERSRLQQRGDGWSGTPTDLAKLAQDADSGIRPDEIMRVVAELGEREQRDGCKINGVEVNYQTASGMITSYRCFNVRSKEELKEAVLHQRERERATTHRGRPAA